MNTDRQGKNFKHLIMFKTTHLEIEMAKYTSKLHFKRTSKNGAARSKDDLKCKKKNLQYFVEPFQQAMMLKRNSKFLALLLITVAIDRIFASFYGFINEASFWFFE